MSIVTTILDGAIDVLMVFAPNIGYVDQYRKIAKARDSSGFSKMVSLVLLLANILRIYFWMGKRFETPLLLQSVLMIAVQLVMLEICVRYGKNAKKASTITDLDVSQFWNWSDFFSYVAFTAVFCLSVGTLSLFMIPISGAYVELLGTMSTTIEAVLGLPQAIKNFKSQSVEGLSPILLGTWFLGDGFKTFYFIFKNQPIQFIACGVFQLVVDCVLLFQYFYYGRKGNKGREERGLIGDTL
ncbi:PQ-loop repeat-containing protein [Acrasis kona]|uniref:Solute carrier family 66 member 2 n=1 Tax=Acrasis kona TaxID=1008807 RepID=A0AAW2YU99_9EUKA